jgi:hypothetical protein
MDGRLDTVSPEHAGFRPVRITAGPLAFGEETAAGQPPEPPGEHRAVHLHPKGPAGLRFEPDTAITKAVLGHFVAIGADVEKYLPAEQFRGIHCHHAGIVREQAEVVGRAQFHQRHRPAGTPLDNFDAAGCSRATGSQAEEKAKPAGGPSPDTPPTKPGAHSAATVLGRLVTSRKRFS